MSSSSIPTPPEDLERTAELPVLDPAVIVDTPEAHTSTDTWASLPALRPEADPEVLGRLTRELEQAQQQLHERDGRLRQLEREREAASAVRRSAEQRASDLGSELTRLQAAQAQQATQLTELAAARALAEQRASDLASELTRLRAAHAQQATQLSELAAARALAEQRVAGLEAQLTHLSGRGDPALEELRAAAEQRAAALDAELTRLQAAATQHVTQFQELAQARARAEERALALDGELGPLRAQLAAAQERAALLERQLAAQQQQMQQAHTELSQHEELRAGRDKVQAAQVGTLVADLHGARERATALYESLQSVHSQRAVFEGLVLELQEEGQGRLTELARVTQSLSERDTQLAEHGAELARRAARIAALEEESGRLGTAVQERDARLRDFERQTQALQASIARLQAQADASHERLQTLQVQGEQYDKSEHQRKSELGQLLAERVKLTTELEQAAAAAAATASQVTRLEEELAQRRSTGAELETALAAERARTQELSAELERVRTEMQEWGSALQSAQRERDTQLAALSAAQARAHTLEQQATHHEESLRSQQAQREEGVTRLRELEADLAAAEEALHRVEAESRARAEQLLQLEQRLAARAAPLAPPPAVTPLAAVRTEEGGVLREGVRRGEQVEGPPAAAAEGATRLLIRSEDGREIVHVLSRKTSVGRTPDNDLQIDAKFISRHHAVILCGPAQTIIEDLNSTNGVHVNGRRITRQVLQDGDSVAIGRQQYRFVVRKGGDKR